MTVVGTFHVGMVPLVAEASAGVVHFDGFDLTTSLHPQPSSGPVVLSSGEAPPAGKLYRQHCTGAFQRSSLTALATLKKGVVGSSPPTETTETQTLDLRHPDITTALDPSSGSLAIRRPTTAGTNLLLFPDPSPPFGEIEISSTLGAFGTSASASTSLDLVDARTLLTGAALSTDETFNAEPGGTKQLQISLTFSNPEPYTYDRYELVAGTGDGATGVAPPPSSRLRATKWPSSRRRRRARSRSTTICTSRSSSAPKACARSPASRRRPSARRRRATQTCCRRRTTSTSAARCSRSLTRRRAGCSLSTSGSVRAAR